MSIQPSLSWIENSYRMKIGLLTVPFNNNFGGFLQAYALKTVLSRNGHEVVIINRRRNRNLNWKGRLKLLLTSLGVIKSQDKRLSLNTSKFISQYLTPGTPFYYSSKDIKDCLKYKFDYCIVGSDQVWRYKYAKDSIEDFFFSFLRDSQVPRMSYAASFGIDTLDEYPEEKKDICRELLRSFSGISVREDSGLRLLEDLGVSKAKMVLDPTLLLTKEHYFENLIKNKQSIPSYDKYVFKYILDESEGKTIISEKISNTLNYKTIKLQAQTGDPKQMEPIAPVEEWLSMIYYSEFVVTDSFHGTVFSILFNKPFVVIGNAARGLTRFESLLSMFNLENRIVSPDSFGNDLLKSPIDWDVVNKEIDEKREASLKFLVDTLKAKQ